MVLKFQFLNQQDVLVLGGPPLSLVLNGLITTSKKQEENFLLEGVVFSMAH